MPFLSISAPSIVSGMSGESEKTLRDAFDEAKVGHCKPPAKNVSSERILAEIRSLPPLY
jgi:SpoVK/Ycf46/Vps4 family AAA+-type ATPase